MQGRERREGVGEGRRGEGAEGGGGWEIALKWIAIDCAAIVWIAVDCIAIDCTVIGSIEIDWVAGEGEEGGEEVRAGEGREQREGGVEDCIEMECNRLRCNRLDCNRFD